MTALVPTEGAKGGGGRAPYEAPNTLRAKQILSAVFLLGEGPAKGLWDGGKSIYFGDPPVPLIASDGSANVLGVQWALRDGSPGQAPFEGVPAVEALVPVGVRVTQGAGPVIRAFDCGNADRVKFIITVPALVRVDTKSGDQLPTSVSYHVDWRESGTNDPWNTLFEDTISGKCVAPYPRSVTVTCPAKKQLEFRMVRDTPDSNSSTLTNDIIWSSVDIITDRQLEYPGCFMVAVKLDAEQFGSDLPVITFGAYGLLCWVPANYDPDTRTYATSGLGTSGGVWDGTFKRAYTNNPAWIFYTLCVDEDFGVGRELAGAVDKWTLYTISQYCDELVDDGFGGQEPRYTCNAYINTRDEAIRVLQAIAQTFRGMLYWGFGQVVPVADMPVDPKKLVTPANVIDGRFEYEGTSLRARHNVVKVRWRDPALNYHENIEVVQDAASIAATRTIREIEIDAVGCTSRGMARRVARWLLYTEKYENEMVRYRAFRDHLDVQPGDVILIQDPTRDGISMSGRLLAASATSLTLDRTVTLYAGNSYSVRVQLPDGTMSEALPVLNAVPSQTDTLTLGGGGLPGGNLPAANHVWMLVVNGKPTSYRILDIAEERDETYSITALRYHAPKFAFVEAGADFNDDPWTIWPTQSGPLEPPTNLQIQEYLTGVGVTTLVRVTLSWTASTDRRVKGYQVQALQDGVVVRDLRVGLDSTVDIADLAPGQYIFQVRALGDNSLTSGWLTSVPTQVDGKNDPPTGPTNLAATGAIRSIIVTWANPDSRFLRTIEVWASSNSTFSAGNKVGESATGRFTHDGLLPETTRYYWIRAADIFGQFSAWIGPVSATTSYLIAADIAQGIIDTAKFAQGIAPVLIIDGLDSPEAQQAADNSTAVNERDGKLYTKSGGQWIPTVQPLGPGGTLTDAQIQSLSATKLAGTLPAAVFSSDLRPVERVAALPSGLTAADEGRTVYLTSDKKLYRWTGSAWSAAVAAADVSGALAASNFPNNLRPVEVVSALPSSGLTDGRVVFLSTDKKIYRYDAAKAAWSKAVDGADITANTITAQAIAAGTITANEIAAGTITADRLVLGDFTNRCENPTFGEGAKGWVSTTGGALPAGVSVVTNDAANAYVGNAYLRITSQASALILARNTNIFPVIPGEKYYLRAHARADAGTTGNLNLRIRWMGADKLTVVAAGVLPFLAATDTAWTLREDVFTAPAGAAYAWVDVQNGAAVSGGWRVGEVFCSRQSGATLIEDGAITASKIAADTITANEIAAGAITAAEIAAGAITADKLAVGSASNLIWNPTCFASVAGWVSHAGAGGQTGTLQAGLLVGPQWGLPTYGSGYMTCAAVTNWVDVGWRPQGGRIPVKPGQKYEFQAAVALGQASVQPYLVWYDAAGNGIGHAVGAVVDGPAALTRADRESDYAQAVVIAAAPKAGVNGATADAAFCVPLLRVKGPGGTVPASNVLLVWSKALFGEALPNQTQPSVWSGGGLTVIDGGLIRTRTLAADALVAGSVTATELAAGSVTAEKLAVGPGSGNVIWNSCCAFNSAGWVPGGTAQAPGIRAVGADWFGANNRLIGYGSGGLFSPNMAAGQFFDAYWHPDGFWHGVPTAAGQWWEFQARVAGWGVDAVELHIAWHDGNNAWISEPVLARTGPVGPGDGWGDGWRSVPDHYTLLWGKAQAPANAILALPIIRGIKSSGATGTAGIVFTQAQFCPARPGQTDPSPWAPGGVTEINGGMIRTNSIVSEHINADQIFGDSGVFNSLKAGIASFGGLKADQIAANQLKAVHMASDLIITGTVQVADLIIGTRKLTNDAATQIAFQNIWQNVTLSTYPGWGPALAVIASVSFYIPPGSDARILILSDGSNVVVPESTFSNYSDPGY